MKQRKKANASSLFLMELIIAILFFSLASGVCIRFFVKSHLLSEEARSLNLAVNACAAAAELAGTADSPEDAAAALQRIYPAAQADTSYTEGCRMRIFYDRNFVPCDPEEALYMMQTDLSDDDAFLDAEIAVQATKDGRQVYALHTRHHLRRNAHGTTQ